MSKCDELKPIHVPAEMCGESTLAEAFDYYERKPVDEAIAELKAENERIRKVAMGNVEELRKFHAEELRATRRALWIARAKRAIEKIAWFKLWNASISTMNPEDGVRQEYDKWRKALGKFLKKAEEEK